MKSKIKYLQFNCNGHTKEDILQIFWYCGFKYTGSTYCCIISLMFKCVEDYLYETVTARLCNSTSPLYVRTIYVRYCYNSILD